MNIKYLEQQINSTYSLIQNTFDDIIFIRTYGSEDERKLKAQEEYYEVLIDKFYNLSLVYFEYLKLPEFVKHIKEKLGESVKNKKSLLKGKYDEESGDIRNDFLLNAWVIFSSCEFFNQDNFTLLHNQNGIDILEEVLKNTDLILKLMKSKSDSEPTVYTPIKNLLKIMFPTIGESKGESFFSTTGNYKPDILIPELKVAIEYKFINTNKDIPKCFDEILADIINYKKENNHREYELYYSVFYFKNVDMTESRFKKICVEKKIPNHWIPICIIERNYKKSKGKVRPTNRIVK